MNVPVSVLRDDTSESLNTPAHGEEHCAVDARTLAELRGAIGRQVLVERSPELLALYTVTERSTTGATVFAGSDGIARLMADTEPDGFSAELRTQFTERQRPARLTEELLVRGTGGLAILAPHGGSIEPGTDIQALTVYAELGREAKPAGAWIARGFNPPNRAHETWHITSTEISERSFPRLGELFDAGPFEHAVAFHGHAGTLLVVGGGLPSDAAHTALKHGIAAAIRNVLPSAMSRKVVVRLDGDLSGATSANIVNRVTAVGNGIQIEQPRGVRENAAQRDAIARAVAEQFAGLL